MLSQLFNALLCYILVLMSSTVLYANIKIFNQNKTHEYLTSQVCNIHSGKNLKNVFGKKNYGDFFQVIIILTLTVFCTLLL